MWVSQWTATAIDKAIATATATVTATCTTTLPPHGAPFTGISIVHLSAGRNLLVFPCSVLVPQMAYPSTLYPGTLVFGGDMLPSLLDSSLCRLLTQYGGLGIWK